MSIPVVAGRGGHLERATEGDGGEVVAVVARLEELLADLPQVRRHSHHVTALEPDQNVAVTVPPACAHKLIVLIYSERDFNMSHKSNNFKQKTKTHAL